MNEGQALLRHILQSHQATPTQLARLAGLSHTTLTRYVGNLADPRPPKRDRLDGETTLRVFAALARLGVDDPLRVAFLDATGYRDLLPVLQHGAVQPDTSPDLIAPQPAATVDQLLQEATALSQVGRRDEALQRAMYAQHRTEHDLARWAEITLRYCANYHQQMGQLDLAYRDIYRVKHRYLTVVDDPHPLIKALFYAQLGWIADQQHGTFDRARQYFTQALQLAREAGDAHLEGQCHHFLVRILSEMAMEKSQSWPGAWPVVGRRIPPALHHDLEQALAHDLSDAETLDPGNIHHHNRRFQAEALIRPRQAVATLQHEQSLYWGHSDHLLAFNEARRDISEAQLAAEGWDAAIAESETAFEGYRRQRLPQGLSQAAAIWSYAQEKRGLKHVEWQGYLDRWVLVMLLHPYPTHPWCRQAAAALVRWLSQTDPVTTQWTKRYLEGLDERVWSRDGMFAALDDVDTLLPFSTRQHISDLVKKIQAAGARSSA